ncbi:MAG: GNAT family protein [Phenylobacterium sp.]|nr:GNAT family protein [Phenylobacterium sp.]MDP3175483.1 GNAT family protein [Phenylobacterium sp.]
MSRFAFTVTIVEPGERGRLEALFAETGFWTPLAGAVAIVAKTDNRLIGTAQFYRPGPCVHGFELGYLLHDRDDRGRGFGAPAVRMFSDHLFEDQPEHHRQQLMIEVWNTASWRLAERSGFVREGIMRSAGLGAGDPGDCFVYSRTRKDWREERHTRVGG